MVVICVIFTAVLTSEGRVIKLKSEVIEIDPLIGEVERQIEGN